MTAAPRPRGFPYSGISVRVPAPVSRTGSRAGARIRYRRLLPVPISSLSQYHLREDSVRDERMRYGRPDGLLPYLRELHGDSSLPSLSLSFSLFFSRRGHGNPANHIRERGRGIVPGYPRAGFVRRRRFVRLWTDFSGTVSRCRASSAT